MAVVADASPIHYLALIGCERVLVSLYGAVLVPPHVVHELTCGGAPAPVRELLAAEPPWLVERTPLTNLSEVENLDQASVKLLPWHSTALLASCSSSMITRADPPRQDETFARWEPWDCWI